MLNLVLLERLWKISHFNRVVVLVFLFVLDNHHGFFLALCHKLFPEVSSLLQRVLQWIFWVDEQLRFVALASLINFDENFHESLERDHLVRVVLDGILHLLLGHFCPPLVASWERLHLCVAWISLYFLEENDVCFLKELNVFKNSLLETLNLVLVVNLNTPYLVGVVKLFCLFFRLIIWLLVRFMFFFASILRGLLLLLLLLFWLVLLFVLLLWVLVLAISLFFHIFLNIRNWYIFKVLTLWLLLLESMLNNHNLDRLYFSGLLAWGRLR